MDREPRKFAAALGYAKHELRTTVPVRDRAVADDHTLRPQLRAQLACVLTDGLRLAAT